VHRDEAAASVDRTQPKAIWSDYVIYSIYDTSCDDRWRPSVNLRGGIDTSSEFPRRLLRRLYVYLSYTMEHVRRLERASAAVTLMTKPHCTTTRDKSAQCAIKGKFLGIRGKRKL
jgi:hypothetical protein